MASQKTPHSVYYITIQATDQDTIDILNEAHYKLRIGHASPKQNDESKRKDDAFELDTNRIPFKLTSGSLTEMTVESVAKLTFTPQGWQYSIGYRLPNDFTEEIHDIADIKMGQIYNVDAEGVVTDPEEAENWVPKEGFGIRNEKTVALSLYRKPKDAKTEVAEEDKLAEGFEEANEFEEDDYDDAYEHFDLWFPGIGTIKPVPEADVPKRILIWFETIRDGKGEKPSTRHQAITKTVVLGQATKIVIYLHTDGRLRNEAEVPSKPMKRLSKKPLSKGEARSG